MGGMRRSSADSAAFDVGVKTVRSEAIRGFACRPDQSKGEPQLRSRAISSCAVVRTLRDLRLRPDPADDLDDTALHALVAAVHHGDVGSAVRGGLHPPDRIDVDRERVSGPRLIPIDIDTLPASGPTSPRADDLEAPQIGRPAGARSSPATALDRPAIIGQRAMVRSPADGVSTSYHH